MGLISFVGNEEGMIGSQFFLTLGEDLIYLDEKHCVFGEVVEGFDILEIINEVICDTDDRPYQDVRVTHTVVLDDPYPNPKGLVVPSRSPSPTAERLQGGRIAPDEEIDEMEGKTAQEMAELQAEREAKARATILEMVGDLPDADMAPPENVLFVCKLNPVTSDDDLEIIFSRFGKIKSCEVIRDKKTGDSLQYAFVEFENQKSCEDAYFKMDNVLIDDRRIHVDFSQSVSKVKWHGKGQGVTHYDERGRKSRDNNNDVGKGNYKSRKNSSYNLEKNRRSVEGNKNLTSDRTSRDSTDYNKSTRSKSKRDYSLSPERRRELRSPKRNESRDTKDQRNRERLVSPKKKEVSRKSESLSVRTERSKPSSASRHYRDDRRYRRDRSTSPRRSNDSKSKYEHSKSSRSEFNPKKHSSTNKKSSYSPEWREKSIIASKTNSNDIHRSGPVSDEENKSGKFKTKKSLRYSEDSASSSDSDEYKKNETEKKRAVKEKRQDTSSDSDECQRKRSKKKKRKS